MKKAQSKVRMHMMQTLSHLERRLREALDDVVSSLLTAEVDNYVREAQQYVDENNHRMVRHNGLSRERTVQTTMGTMTVQQPRVDDRREGHKFTSVILPPYVRRTENIDALVVTLYLHGVSTVRMEAALREMFGSSFSSMSPAVVSGIIEKWQELYEAWSKREITKRYAYIWVDGIYTTVRTTSDRPCMLVVIGCDEHGNKETLAILDGECESEISWSALLLDLKRRGLKAPRLAIGDGALGFWTAIGKVFPSTVHQGCTVHATRNVLDKLPKKLHDTAKQLLQEFFRAATLEDARKAYDIFKRTFIDKYPKAVATISDRLERLLAYYHFPAAHWKSIRSTNVIESMFATIRRRSKQTNGNGSREAALAMMFMLAKQAEKTWRKIDGFDHVANVLQGLEYNDGVLKMAD
jgi:transposase-like protein